MKLKTLLLAVCALASIAIAHAQVDIVCNRGHHGCTIIHDDTAGNGGVQDPGSNDGSTGGTGGGVNDIDGLGGGGGTTSGGGNGDNPVLDPPTGGQGPTHDSDAERIAREAEEARLRLEKARKKANDQSLSEEARRAAAQEAVRAEGRMRYELNSALSRIRNAANSSSAKLRKDLKTLQTWQQEMVKAGLTKEVAQWYVDNKSTISELVTAYGVDADGNPGPLKWLADNQGSLKELADAKDDLLSLKGDSDDVREYYKEWKDAKGKTHEPLMSMAIDLNETRNEVSSLWNSLGAETWVKILAILGPVLAIAAFLLRKK
jgi:hypothetical protein